MKDVLVRVVVKGLLDGIELVKFLKREKKKKKLKILFFKIFIIDSNGI